MFSTMQAVLVGMHDATNIEYTKHLVSLVGGNDSENGVLAIFEIIARARSQQRHPEVSVTGTTPTPVDVEQAVGVNAVKYKSMTTEGALGV